MVDLKKILLVLIIGLVTFVPNLQARPIVTDLAVRSVDIDHDFTGLDILLFGARNDVGRIFVVLRGPKKDYVVRKKEKVAGIWVNKQSVKFENVDSFYAIAGGNLADVRNDHLLDSLGIGIENIALKTNSKSIDVETFRKALIANKQEEDLYAREMTKISFWDETLFRTVLKFPKNIERGLYTAEVYLFDDGLLSAVQSTPIKVSKIGFEAFVFDLAQNQKLLYGIICVFMALAAGWTANTIFGRI